MWTTNPNRKEIMLLALAAKMWRDFTIDLGKWDKIYLKYGDHVLTSTSNQTKNLLLKYIRRKELTWDLRFQMRWQLWDHDEWYRKKLYEHAVYKCPNTLWFKEQHNSLVKLNFNSSLFWDERGSTIESETMQILWEARESIDLGWWEEEAREEDTEVPG